MGFAAFDRCHVLDREGDDALTVWVAIEEDGKVHDVPFRYRRVR